MFFLHFVANLGYFNVLPICYAIIYHLEFWFAAFLRNPLHIVMHKQCILKHSYFYLYNFIFLLLMVYTYSHEFILYSRCKTFVGINRT